MSTLSQWLLRFSGTDAATLPADADTELVLAHWPESWRVVLLLAATAAAVTAVWWLYRRERNSCPRRIRLLLAGLRTASVLLVVLVLLGPALEVRILHQVVPTVLVVLDDSLSMSLADRYSNRQAADAVSTFLGRSVAKLRSAPPTRGQLLNHLITRDDGAFLRSLTARGRVRVVSASDRLRLRNSLGADDPLAPAPLPTGPAVPPFEPEGSESRLLAGIREAVQSQSGSPIAAVCFLSDGNDTTGDAASRTAEQLARRRIPLFAIEFGDPDEPRNLRIGELWAPARVSSKDPMKIQARLHVRGLEPQPVTLALLRAEAGQDALANGTVIAEKRVAITPDRAVYDLEFSHHPATPGTYTYAVRAPRVEGELLTDDNSRTATVEVLDRKVRLLLLAGGPTWDYRLVRNLLQRDPTIDLSCWLQSMDPQMRQEGNTPIAKLPDAPAELFAYDAVIALDPAPDQLPPNWWELLRDFVGKQAGGLLCQAGPMFSEHGFRLTRAAPLRELLPVRLATNTTTTAGAWRTPYRIRPATAGADHPALQLATDPALNARLWESMPGCYWWFPHAGAKPGALVLAQRAGHVPGPDAQLPLLVAGQYGPGRVLFAGFNGTWRWRAAGEEHFDRFWVQMVRDLAQARTLRGQRRGQLATDRTSYPVGDRATINARLLDSRYAPLQEPAVTATLTTSRGQRDIELTARPDRPGHYQAAVVVRHLGPHQITLPLPDVADNSAAITHRFRVELPNIEFVSPQLNRPLLRALAEQTGGAVLTVDQAMSLAQRIPERRQTIIVRGRPIDLWDNAAVLWLLVALLTIEWTIRKWKRLI